MKIFRDIWFQTKTSIQINNLEYSKNSSKLTKCILTLYMTIKKKKKFAKSRIGISCLSGQMNDNNTLLYI